MRTKRRRKDILANAIGGINSKYILEAIQYTPKNRHRLNTKWLKYLSVLVLSIYFLAEYILVMPFHQITVAAYFYDTEKEISTDAILSTGSISDNVEMKEVLLRFHLTGKSIQTIRFSCKNQWLEFTDWTKQRDNYGNAKNFTASFTDYKITTQNIFVLQPDSNLIGSNSPFINEEFISPEDTNFTKKEIRQNTKP